MPSPTFAMDTSFYSYFGAYDFDARCEMLRELGYDGTYLTLWNEPSWADLERLPRVKEKHGIDVSGVFCTVDIAAPDDHPDNNRVLAMLKSVEGCSNIEVCVKGKDNTVTPSDPRWDDSAARWLERMLGVAEPRNLTLSLYPHIVNWVERVEDGVRLCKRMQHPNLGVVFCGFHWFAADGKDLRGTLKAAAPYLRSANVCGSRKPGPVGGVATIETLDRGELDNFMVLAALAEAGYRGPVGIQGYNVQGDPYLNLERSLAAYRSMARRLEQHPDWAKTHRWS